MATGKQETNDMIDLKVMVESSMASNMSSVKWKLRILELYSGIGGMHWALKGFRFVKFFFHISYDFYVICFEEKVYFLSVWRG